MTERFRDNNYKRNHQNKKKKRKGCRRVFFGLLILLLAGLGVKQFMSNSDRIVIAIDPGHGGLDIGAKGIINEASMNERTAKNLHKLLKEDKRFKPIYTRKFKEDVKYTLAERIKASDKNGASLLISIHGNSSSNKNSRGFECYASPPGRNNHKESVRFATIIAEKIGAAGHRLRGENGVRFLYYLESDKKGTTLDIRESSYTNTERTEAGIAMVENPKCPSILVEQCFVNNLEDYEQWGNEEGAQRAAQIYYEGICEYFGLSSIPREN